MGDLREVVYEDLGETWPCNIGTTQYELAETSYLGY